MITRIKDDEVFFSFSVIIVRRMKKTHSRAGTLANDWGHVRFFWLLRIFHPSAFVFSTFFVVDNKWKIASNTVALSPYQGWVLRPARKECGESESRGGVVWCVWKIKTRTLGGLRRDLCSMSRFGRSGTKQQTHQTCSLSYVTLAEDKTCRIWDLRTDKVHKALTGFDSAVNVFEKESTEEYVAVLH